MWTIRFGNQNTNKLYWKIKTFWKVYENTNLVCNCVGSDVIDSCDLVPGDLIEVPTEGCVMTCDALLLTGTCIVNECVLTGMLVYQFNTNVHVEVYHIFIFKF